MGAEISDALDALKLPGSALGIRPVAGLAKLFGFAFTVRFAPIDRSSPGTVGDFIDTLKPGTVAVLDNGGRLDCTVWGGIMSRLAAHKGLAGTDKEGILAASMLSTMTELQMPAPLKVRRLRS